MPLQTSRATPKVALFLAGSGEERSEGRGRRTPAPADQVGTRVSVIFFPLPPVARDPGIGLQAGVDVLQLLGVGADDLFRDAGPPVHVAGGVLLRRILR